MITSDFEKIDLYVSCRKLKNLDHFVKIDFQASLYSKDRTGVWKIVSRSEIIKGNVNPNFETTFAVDFVFEVQQPLKFEVAEIDASNNSEIIGSVETSLGAIMGAKGQTLGLELRNNTTKSKGKIILKGEKAGNTRNVIRWQWSGIKNC